MNNIVNAQNSLELLNHNIPLKLNSKLHLLKRKNLVLLIEPHSASWITFGEKYLKWLKFFKYPATLKQFYNNNNTSFNLIENFFLFCYLNGILQKDHTTPGHKIADNIYHSHFAIYLTERCNFDCQYCWNSFHNIQPDMGPKTLNLILKKIISEHPAEYITIGFHGGEPLLNSNSLFNGIRRAKKYAKAYEKKIHFEIQTNGWLLNREKIETLAKLGIKKIGISLDGSSTIHNKYRRLKNSQKTFDGVWKNCMAAQKKGIEVYIYSCINNVKDLLDSFEFLSKNNLTKLAFQIMRPEGRAKNNLRFDYEYYYNFHAAFESIYNKIDSTGESFNPSNEIMEKNISRIKHNILFNSRPDICLKSPCGAIRSTLAFSPAGDIYPCNLFYRTEKYKIGNIRDIQSFNKIEKLKFFELFQSRTVENILKCKNCPVKNICCGHCAAFAHKTHNDIFRATEPCAFYYNLILKIMWKLGENTPFK